VAPLANSPSLDELGDQPSPEGSAVALELVVSGHGTNGSDRPRKIYRPADFTGDGYSERDAIHPPEN